MYSVLLRSVYRSYDISIKGITTKNNIDWLYNNHRCHFIVLLLEPRKSYPVTRHSTVPTIMITDKCRDNLVRNISGKLSFVKQIRRKSDWSDRRSWNRFHRDFFTVKHPTKSDLGELNFRRNCLLVRPLHLILHTQYLHFPHEVKQTDWRLREMCW